MKELDKAIVNGDVEQIVFLLKEGVDAKGAVLIHLKNQLVPEYFTEDALLDKGVILTVDALRKAIPEFISVSQTDYRYETYMKRLYLGTQALLNTWRQGKFFNSDIEAQFNQQAMQHLQGEWIKGSVISGIAEYAESKQKEYIDFKFQQWQQKTLDSGEMKTLDKIALDSLMSYWYKVGEESDNVINKISANQSHQRVEYLRHEDEADECVTDMLHFLSKRMEGQIIDGSINDEAIKDIVEQEKDYELKGNIKANMLPEYRRAIRNVLEKWRNGSLDRTTNRDVQLYIQKHLQDYQLPQNFKKLLVERSIEQLLQQYKVGDLEENSREVLSDRFEFHVASYLQEQATGDTEFRQELGDVIFSNLLRDWKNDNVDVIVAKHLQENLLPDMRGMLQDLSFYTSRSAMFSRVRELQAEVDLLRGVASTVSASDEKNTDDNNGDRLEASDEAATAGASARTSTWASMFGARGTLPAETNGNAGKTVHADSVVSFNQ